MPANQHHAASSITELACGYQTMHMLRVSHIVGLGHPLISRSLQVQHARLQRFNLRWQISMSWAYLGCNASCRLALGSVAEWHMMLRT